MRQLEFMAIKEELGEQELLLACQVWEVLEVCQGWVELVEAAVEGHSFQLVSLQISNKWLRTWTQLCSTT